MFSAEFETSQWLNCSKTVLLSLLHFRMLISRPINFYDGRLNVNTHYPPEKAPLTESYYD